ncbi:hypothetical protein A9R01_01035 ['Osedax' symbiont bacterium Rs2_46_30_T18]|nr:hypothetical protein A9R01_01035 ['Osedax' symbiont bacterium Rs2_46_30_T18]
MADKNLLLIFRNPPFADSSNRDTLDIALACSAFDIPVSLIFLHDGILQLTRGQQSKPLQQKNLLNTFNALAMYDINQLFVLQSDLQRFELTTADLSVDCQAISDSKMAQLLRQSDRVINL